LGLLLVSSQAWADNVPETKDLYTYPEVDCNATEYSPATNKTGWKNPTPVGKVHYPFKDKSDFLVPSGFFGGPGYKFKVARSRDAKQEHSTHLTVEPPNTNAFDVYSVPSGKTGCNAGGKTDLLAKGDAYGDDVLDKEFTAKSPPKILRLCFLVNDKNKAGDVKDTQTGYEVVCQVKHNPKRDKEREDEKKKDAKGPDDSGGGGTGGGKTGGTAK